MILPLILVLALAAPTSSVQIGFAGRYSGRPVCLGIDDSTLVRGTPVTLVRPPLAGLRETSEYRRAEVIAVTDSCASSLQAGGRQAYQLALTVGDSLEPNQAYLAFVGTHSFLGSTSRSARLSIDGRPTDAQVCASQEGLHFTLWLSSGRRRERIWHQYVPLFYDMEPNCSEPETR